MADAFKACAVEACKGNAHYAAGGAKGWCRAHYRRNYRYGDPTAGNTRKGEPLAWLASHLTHKGDACLAWPFGCDAAGYGQINVGGRVHYVHRLICEAGDGAPGPGQHAAHTCGKGSEACCNPKHVRWASPAENAADKVLHGTLPLGERHHAAKLTADDVRQIRAMRGQMTQRQIGALFGVTEDAIGCVQRRENWDWLA